MKLLILVLMLFSSANVFAEPISFEVLWAKIKSESPTLEKEGYQAQASELASSRLEKHWLPSLALGASAFSTNDPASNFFSNLSQRQISASDFATSNLNEPGRNTFETLSLGVDLPLYEGGVKLAESNALSKLSEAAIFNQKAVVLEEYIETAKSYSQLNTLSVADDRLKYLLNRVSEILSKYSIGSPSNPVGYSGLLGLKSLKNRIEGEMITLESKVNAQREILTEKAKLDEKSWTTKTEETLSFLNRTMPTNYLSTKPSYSELSAIAQSEAADHVKDIESSRFLPRLGLFANEGLTHGNRGTGTSFTGGVYLQWSLFNPNNLNRAAEKNATRLAMDAHARSIKQESEIGRKTLQQTEDSVKKNIELLVDSEKLLAEQVKVTSKLFQSGSISALQLTEVLNRRVDLIINLSHIEQELVEIRAKRMMLTQAEGAFQ